MRAISGPLNLGLFAFDRFALALNKNVDDLLWLYRLGIVVAAVAFGLLWRPVARVAIPLGLCAFLAVSSHSVRGGFRDQAIATSRDPALNPNPQWVSDAVGDVDVGYLFGGDVGYLFGGDLDVFGSTRTMLSVNFWNPPLRSVIHVGPRELCQLPSREARIDPSTGHIVAADRRDLPPYLVAPISLGIAGSAVARQGPLALYRAMEPASLLHSVEGVYSDRWMGADATFTRYSGPGAGEVVVELSREVFNSETVPSVVRITAGPLVHDAKGRPGVGRPRTTRRSVLRAGNRKVFAIPAGRFPFRVRVQIEPTFSAAAFGTGDSRELGALVDFGFRR
jgi:hypothetical protein